MDSCVRYNLNSIKYYLCVIIGIVVIVCVSSTYFNVNGTIGIQPSCVEITSSNVQLKPHLVLGILSFHSHRELRNVQRKSWVSTIHRMENELPFKITYKYLIDKPTNETIKENEIYKDIIFLNATHSGRAVKFGEKLYLWFNYIYKYYPDALLGAKIDDDVFLCVPQVINRLYSLKSSKLYYGWSHGGGKKVNTYRRCDEMFVVLGRELIARIAKRTYCGARKCNSSDHLIDTNYGGTSLGTWLSMYDDIDFHPDNARIIHFGRGKEASYAKYITKDFCQSRLIFHKSAPEVMKQLHKFNTITAGCTSSTSSLVGAVTGSRFSGEVVRQIPRTIMIPQIKTLGTTDNTMDCENWAVVTTIFAPSKAVANIAKLDSWCLVIVADTKTPSKNAYLKGIVNKRIKYLTLKEQQTLYPLLSETIPFQHFGRKNIGYMYAIHHKAKAIWDFDDDNIGIVNLHDFNKQSLGSKYVTASKDFNNSVLNPYPYFGVKDSRTWPRGFPLQQIKDPSTIPQICKPEKLLKIGVIQSLANQQPDVDAIYRLTREVPFNFVANKKSHRALVLPRNVYAPFNAQATLWMPTTFSFMPLPMSVSGRVSDIWRSYIAQYFMFKNDIRLAFSIPYVIQERNAHTIIKDFNAELDLYSKSKQLVDFMSSSSHSNITDMYKDLYRRQYLEEEDLSFIDAWQKTLMDINKQNHSSF